METKQVIILRILGLRSLNRFEAENLGDHCLHSTVAVLRAYQHKIYDRWKKVPTRFNKETRVKRYFLIKRA